MFALWWATLAVLVIWRRWRHLLRAELDDWFLDGLDSWDGRTRILFSRLIDDFALTIELTRSCDRGQASETATDQPGTRRFDRAIGFVSRDQLADQVRRYSGGRLQLDPERPQQPK
jgi:hypothetical protein